VVHDIKEKFVHSLTNLSGFKEIKKSVRILSSRVKEAKE